MRRAVAMLLIFLSAGYGCSSGGSTPPPPGCSIDQARLRQLLRDATKGDNVALNRIDQQTCTADWAFVQAEFTGSDGTPTDPTGFVLHRTGQGWETVYKGTGPVEPGNPLCGQLPTEIKQAPGLRGTCPD